MASPPRPETSRLPRERALLRAAWWKRFSSYAAVTGFGLFVFLAAHHVTGVTAHATVTTPSPSVGGGEDFFGGSSGNNFGSGVSPGVPTTSTGAS